MDQEQKRLKLQAILQALLGSDHVYFQPPANIQMAYPCIVYQRDSADTKYADNSTYRHTRRYQVTYIDRKPNSPVPEKVAELPMCSFSRFYVVDNLNHDVFNIFF